MRLGKHYNVWIMWFPFYPQLFPGWGFNYYVKNLEIDEARYIERSQKQEWRTAFWNENIVSLLKYLRKVRSKSTKTGHTYYKLISEFIHILCQFNQMLRQTLSMSWFQCAGVYICGSTRPTRPYILVKVRWCGTNWCMYWGISKWQRLGRSLSNYWKL